jgi:hypothetical protein
VDRLAPGKVSVANATLPVLGFFTFGASPAAAAVVVVFAAVVTASSALRFFGAMQITTYGSAQSPSATRTALTQERQSYCHDVYLQCSIRSVT